MKPYYQDDAVTIYHCDCREMLAELEPVCLVLTDPPYGIGEAAGKNLSRCGAAYPTDYGVEHWDDAPISDDLIVFIRDMAPRVVIFGGNYYANLLGRSRGWLVWDKDNTGDFADCELAWTNLPQAVRKLKYRWNGMLQEPGKPREKRSHPTQKPLQLMTWCIAQADKHGTNSTIFDPFMGSGTTLRAAKDLGRRAIGIDRVEKYCEIAAHRMSQSVLAL